MIEVFLTHDSDALNNFYGEQALNALRELADVRMNDCDRLLDTLELIAQAKNAAIIVADVNTPAQAELFEDLPDLVAFLRCAVDVRTVDIDAASRNGVLVTNASPGFVNSVSELVLGLMVDLARGVTAAAASYHGGDVPPKHIGVQLHGSTIGILGYGAIGQFVAQLARAIGMTVLAADPHKTIDQPGIEQVTMDQLLIRSDFVVCLVVANDETENLMAANAFSRMKPSALFINVSRGNLVDEKALFAALTDGQIAGAALDVGRAPGQMPSLELAKLANVIATPHIGGLTPAATQSQAMETVEQVKALVAGRIPHNARNAASASRLSRLGVVAAAANLGDEL